jgi:hypothetical protein
MATMVLAEPGDGYVTEWYCDPPPWRARFTVLRDEWETEHGYPVRRIYEFRLAAPVPVP